MCGHAGCSRRVEIPRGDGVRCCNLAHAIARFQAHRDGGRYCDMRVSHGVKPVVHLQRAYYEQFACSEPKDEVLVVQGGGGR